MLRFKAAGCVAVVLTALAGMPPAQARAPYPVACHTISDTQVRALFDRWNKALATQNPDTVTATYATDASLLPTVQNGPLIGPAAIRGYFTSFLKKAPAGVIDQRAIHIGCNIAYDIGLYTITVDGDQPGTRKPVKARYSFIYAPNHGTWLIVHHHSSIQPEPAK